MKQKGERCMKKRQQMENIWLWACISGLGCLLVTVLLSLPVTKLIEGSSIPIKAMNVVSYIILGLSALAGAIFTACKGKKRILLLCLVTATVYFLSLVILNGVLQKGRFQRIGETALIIYAVSVAAGLLCSKRKKRY